MEHVMHDLFTAIKDDEWVWMESMLAFQQKVVPQWVRESEPGRSLLKMALVAGLVPMGFKSLIVNLGRETTASME